MHSITISNHLYLFNNMSLLHLNSLFKCYVKANIEPFLRGPTFCLIQVTLFDLCLRPGVKIEANIKWVWNIKIWWQLRQQPKPLNHHLVSGGGKRNNSIEGPLKCNSLWSAANMKTNLKAKQNNFEGPHDGCLTFILQPFYLKLLSFSAQPCWFLVNGFTAERMK